MTFTACKPINHSVGTSGPKAFERTITGKAVHLYMLRNGRGMIACLTNYGGRLISLVVPDKNNDPTNVVIGFPDLEGYEKSTEPYFGAIIGRYSNRITSEQFQVTGQDYQLSINNGLNKRNGGKQGFQDKVFDAVQPDRQTLILYYLSKDDEECFTGNLDVKVIYTLTDANELKIEYLARTDKPTVVNLANHAFFNLNGEGGGSILQHSLRIKANLYTQVDSMLIPTGQLVAVSGTPFDFRKGFTIGARINDHNQQLSYGNGYDHNFVLNPHSLKTPVADVLGDKSGILMQLYTDQPGLQFYSGNYMQGKNQMRGYNDDLRTAFCLETQHFLDSPNEPQLPSAVLEPGQVYSSRTIYKFLSE